VEKNHPEKLFLETLNFKSGEFDEQNYRWGILYYGNLNNLRTFINNIAPKYAFKLWQPSFKQKVFKNKSFLETRRLVFPGYSFIKSPFIEKIVFITQEHFSEFYVYFLFVSESLYFLSKEEEEWIKRLEDIMEKSCAIYVPVKVGDLVSFNDNRFGSLVGRVEEIDADKWQAKVGFIFFKDRKVDLKVNIDDLRVEESYFEPTNLCNIA
jgi:transcription antitermination factor NusG